MNIRKELWKLGKILVVDDQIGVRRLLAEIFKQDHKVLMAENGMEALRLLIPFKPDLIFMDMKMPGMNGIQTLEKIRALDRRVELIMMSAYGDIQNMEQAKDLGIRYFVDKPFDLFELRERVSVIFNSPGIINKALTN